MTTDFSYGDKTINSLGPIKPSGTNQPLDPRTEVKLYADIETIPNPYVGMIITVLQDETNSNKMTDYKVLSLKANSLGVANSVVDQVQRYVDYLGANGQSVDTNNFATKEEIGLKADKTELHSHINKTILDGITSANVNNWNNKVDKVKGKTLTTNDYTNEEKQTVASLKATVGDTSSGLVKDVKDLKENGVSQDNINTAIENYLTEHPVQSGATAEQAAQIEANRVAIGDSNSGLTKEINDIKNNLGQEIIKNTTYSERLSSVELFVETCFDGGNQPIHVKVIELDAPLNGYKYWMAYTPYPYAVDGYENPSVACSKDLIKWETPKGLNNPIDTPHTEEKDKYHSDTHILFNKDTAKLEVWYRTVCGNGVRIYRKTSSDGIIWSNRELLKNYPTERIINAGCVCPVVIYENGKYNIWIFDVNNTEGLGASIIKYETSDATNWGTPTKCNGITNVWHFDIVKHNGEYICYTDIRSKSQYLFTSADGLEWGNKITIMQDDEKKYGNFYRSSLLFTNNKWYFFYCFKNTDSSWGMSLSISQNEDYNTLKGIDESYLTKMAKITAKSRFAKPNTIVWDKYSNVLMKCVSCDAYGAIWVDVNGNELDKNPTNVLLTSISFDKKNLNLTKGGTYQLSINYVPKNAMNKKVTWNTSDNTKVTVSDTGLVTAIELTNSDTPVSITATSTDGSAKEAKCLVTVVENAPEETVNVLEGMEVLTFDGSDDELWEMSVYGGDTHGVGKVSSIFQLPLPDGIDGTDNNFASFFRDFAEKNYPVVKGATLPDLISKVHENCILVREDNTSNGLKGIFVEITNNLLTDVSVSGFKQYLASNNIEVYARTKVKNQCVLVIDESSPIATTPYNNPSNGVFHFAIGKFDKAPFKTNGINSTNSVCPNYLYVDYDSGNFTKTIKNVYTWDSAGFLRIGIDANKLISFDIASVKDYLRSNPIIVKCNFNA